MDHLCVVGRYVWSGALAHAILEVLEQEGIGDADRRMVRVLVELLELGLVLDRLHGILEACERIVRRRAQAAAHSHQTHRALPWHFLSRIEPRVADFEAKATSASLVSHERGDTH